MSTRDERRAWQAFRESHGATPRAFKQLWHQMFLREPTEKELMDYMTKRAELRAPLGRKKKPRIEVTNHLVEPTAVDDTYTPPQRRQYDGLPPVAITKRWTWEMGHRLPNHQGKCFRLHGHSYVAEIEISGQLHTSGPTAGMVTDFYVINQLIETLIGNWDHRTMLHVNDPLIDAISGLGTRYDESLGLIVVSFMPTAENIAREIMRLFLHKGVQLTRVRVYETPSAWAEIRG